MKLKLKNSAQGMVINAKTTGREDLIYSEAETARTGASQTLLPFTYMHAKKGYEFQYYLGPSRRLGDYLQTPIAREYLEAMLISFLTLSKDCDAHNLSIQRVVFQTDYLFFNPGLYSLVFVYAPLKAISDNLGSALGALEFIATHAYAQDFASKELAQALFDFSKRSAFFSWIEYERFLQEQGVLEKKADRHMPSLKRKETKRIDCKESFGFDFVAAAAETGELDELSTAYGLHEVGSGHVWSLVYGNNEVGSLPTSAISLGSAIGVSRHHANVRVAEDGVYVTDLHSTNGVYLNGSRLTPDVEVKLHEQDVVHFAREQFVLKRLQS